MTRLPARTRRRLNTAAQLAPAHTVVPVVCRCEHPRLIHRDGVCLRLGCGCTEYEETL